MNALAFRFLCLFAVLFTMNSGSLWAKSTYKRALKMPEKYRLPKESTDKKPTKKFEPSMFWQAFCIQENAPSYPSAKLGNAINQLEYLASFWVAAEKNDFVFLVEDPRMGYKGNFSESASDKGWVEKRDLLFWKNALVTEVGRIPRKIMLLNTFDYLGGDDTKGGRVPFYLDRNRKIKSDFSSGLFEIFFLYEIDRKNNSALLGKSHFFTDGSQEDNILRWVDLSRTVLWDQRVALEPNWEPEAVEERKRKGTPTSFFGDKNSAVSYKENAKLSGLDPIWKDDPLGTRKIGEYRRFPVIKGRLGSTVLNVGVMGEIRAGSGNSQIVSADQMAHIQDVVQEAKKQARTVNIVFVVDATRSMDRVFKPIMKGIQNAVEEIRNQDGNKNTYNFGAVLYRDFAEGKYKTHKADLDSDHTKVLDLFNQVLLDFAKYNRKDRDDPESPYLGIKEAIRGLGMNKEETNVIIWVGDAGNRYEGQVPVNQEEIINLLNMFSCHLLAFQAQHLSRHATYDDFVGQSKTIIRALAMSNYNAQKEMSQRVGLNLRVPSFDQDPNEPHIWRLFNGSISGAALYAPKNGSLSGTALSNEITRLIRDLRESHNEKLNKLEALTMSGASMDQTRDGAARSPYVGDFEPGIVNFLSRIKGLSEEEIEIILGQSAQRFTEGYAPIKLNGQEHPLFKPVLILTLTELADILREMEQIHNAGASGMSSERRQKLVEAWYAIIRAHIGDISVEEMETWSLERASEAVFGLPTVSDLGKKPLKDLMDKALVDDFEINVFIDGIDQKIEQLRPIFNQTNSNCPTFMSNDIRYFWIEQDLIP